MNSDMRLPAILQGKTFMLAGAAILAATAVGYPLWRGLLAPKPLIDFPFYWLAGHMWAQGLDPYSSQYQELGTSFVPPLQFWFYPPHWWPICRALALFDLPTAAMVWRATLSIILLGSTGFVVALLTRRQPLRQRILYVAAACALATSIEPTANVLTSGQVSPIFVYLGLAAIICGQLLSSTFLLALGVASVSLKPQIGLVVVVAFLISPRFRKPVVYAVVASALLALPQIIPFGPITTLREMVSNLGAWSQISSNGSFPLTGLGHITARLGFALPASMQFAIALATAIASGLLIRREPSSLAPMALLFGGMTAFVPLHNYDMTFLLLLGVVLLKLERSYISRLLVAGALLLVVRPNRLEHALGITWYDDANGVLLYSVASIILLGIAVHAALIAISRRAPPPRLTPATS